MFSYFFGARRMKTRLVVLTMAAVLIAGTTLATPVVDGIFDPTEGYSSSTLLDLYVEDTGYATDQGQLWAYQDMISKDIFAAVILPKTLVDNSYGDNSIGWGSEAASEKNHSFKDLKGSDGAEFELFNNLGETVLHVELDYITEKDGHVSSLGVFGGEGEVHVGDGSLVTAWGTSLDYNFNTLGHELKNDSPEADDDYIVDDSIYTDWLFDVVYEIQIDGSVFGDNSFGSIETPLLHISPNKVGKNKVYPEPVPEPATLALLGLGGILLRKRKRVA